MALSVLFGKAVLASPSVRDAALPPGAMIGDDSSPNDCSGSALRDADPLKMLKRFSIWLSVRSVRMARFWPVSM